MSKAGSTLLEAGAAGEAGSDGAAAARGVGTGFSAMVVAWPPPLRGTEGNDDGGGARRRRMRCTAAAAEEEEAEEYGRWARRASLFFNIFI
jgi:hypothetical protein